MKKTLCVLMLASALAACSDDATSTMVDFESVALGEDGTLTGATRTPSIEVGDLLLYTYFDQEYMTFSGFSVSSLTDTTTPGYMNALSVFPGSGAGGSKQFAIWNPPFGSDDPALEFARDVNPLRVQVANTTYAALSMQSGDQFAKKFTAADEDFFKVTFAGVDADGKETGTVEHYLADFRGGDTPGIQKDWQEVDLSGLGTVRSIAIRFDSSDVGTYGINTPLYVAIDDVEFEDVE